MIEISNSHYGFLASVSGFVFRGRTSVSSRSFLLELKKIDLSENNKSTEEIMTLFNKAAQEALQQINQQFYAAEIKQRKINNLLKIGIAFCGKRFGITHEKC